MSVPMVRADRWLHRRVARRRSLTTGLPSSRLADDWPPPNGPDFIVRDQAPFPAKGFTAQRDPAPDGSDAQEGVIGMSAAATSIGVTAPLVSYPEPGTGRQDWPGFASGYCAEREAKHLAAVARTLQWADEAAERGDYLDLGPIPLGRQRVRQGEL